MRDLERASAAARHEWLLLRLLALSRVVVLGQAAASLAFHWDATEGQGVVIGLLVLLVLDNAALLLFHLRRGLLDSRCLATADVGVGMAALVAVVALLKPAANPGTDDILYPYTVAAVSVIGLVYRRIPAALAAATATSAIYVSVTLWRFGIGSGTTVLANASTYWAWALAGWFLADRFGMLSVELDDARRVVRALEQERERARLSRSLHDHVLQTLEFMSRDGWIADPMIRDHVAAEAAWLRDLVRGELAGRGGALSAALDRVVQRHTRAGLRIELNTCGLGSGTISQGAVEAIAGAVTELLTNVRKHAGTTRAVVRAVSAPGTVIVTVLDSGSGFDTGGAAGGVGLRESVIARIHEVDGRVVVTSEPGAGTHVKITVPSA